MPSGSDVFESGNAIEVPFGTAPANTGRTLTDGIQLTSLGVSDGFNVVRIRNGMEEEINVTLQVLGGPDSDTVYVIPPNTDLIVRSLSTGEATFRLLDESGNLIRVAAANRGLDGNSPPEFGAEFAVCFAADSLISTPNGERPVQELSIGDAILTDCGRTIPVLWLGIQTIIPVFNPPEKYAPVRILEGAFGPGLPHKDLVVTADHALIFDGLAINASALVNGTTIVFDSPPERASYYHIETEHHEVILANGLATETYIDCCSRRVFDNYTEYVALYSQERNIVEMSLPRVSSNRLVPRFISNLLVDSATAA